ncbi:hypothetical protein Q8A73_000076 [Channa argus]|nr:hypothetical protein Q8A73_000076 [Channa argus]
MSKVQMLRAFVNQRLSAAAEEIFELFERTIAEYEQHLYRSQGDRERLREHLDSAVDLHGADTQQMLVGEAEVFSQQHDWNTNLEHVDQPEMSHIKEEQKEPWSSQEEERSQKLRETTGITEFSFFPATVKSENDEKSQSSELHQCLTAKKSEAELPEAGSNGDSHRGSELAKNLLPYRHLEPNRDHDISHYMNSEERFSSQIKFLISKYALLVCFYRSLGSANLWDMYNASRLSPLDVNGMEFSLDIIGMNGPNIKKFHEDRSNCADENHVSVSPDQLLNGPCVEDEADVV